VKQMDSVHFSSGHTNLISADVNCRSRPKVPHINRNCSTHGAMLSVCSTGYLTVICDTA